jgi:hypothetical protein
MTVAVPSVVGFRAQLSGASLWDLVQMECMARSRTVIRVTGQGGVGYLYFADGRVVHAATVRLVGEPAALEILGWTNGVFQPCDRAWPAQPTIETSCEGLILRLAKRRDDESASNLVAFPGRAGDDERTSGGAAGFEEIHMSESDGEEQQKGPQKEKADMRTANIDQTALPTAIGRNDLTADFPVVLRLGAGGTIVKNKGGDEDMAGVVAYAQRLGQLAGELMGLDPFVAMECTFTEGRLMIFSEENGDTVALRPRSETNLQPLRDKLGL